MQTLSEICIMSLSGTGGQDVMASRPKRQDLAEKQDCLFVTAILRVAV